jgi:hypothetical protein
MDRSEFERLRELTGKTLKGDIVLRRPSARAYFESGRMRIETGENIEVFVVVRWNPETDAKTVNVDVAGVGPICRLDIDATVHPPAGRHHKHSLRGSQCPEENLKRDVVARNDLAGQDISAVFAEFCRVANIKHDGILKVQE